MSTEKILVIIQKDGNLMYTTKIFYLQLEQTQSDLDISRYTRVERMREISNEKSFFLLKI